VCKTKETPSIDDDRGCDSSLRAILAFEEYIRKRADRIGELLMIEVARAGPDGMECDRFDREDPLPFRIDPDPLGCVSWHLTLSYGGPAGDALGSRARWSDSGEIAAECVIDTLGLVEALASGRLASFFRDLADWLESEVRPRGLATEDRIKEGAGIARDLAERCRDLKGCQDLDRMAGDDRNLRS
jgi:hypothetical protein